MNRRKLGSSRKNKGKRQAKGSETEPYLEVREDVEDTEDIKTLETAEATQPDIQEELTRGSEQRMSTMHSSFLFSDTSAENSEVEIPTISLQNDIETSVSQTGYLQSVGELDQESTGKPDFFENEEIKFNAHVSQSTSDSESACVLDEELKNKQAAHCNMYSVPESESNESSDIDLLRQDGSTQGNHFMSESDVNSVLICTVKPDMNTHKVSSTANDKRCSTGEHLEGDVRPNDDVEVSSTEDIKTAVVNMYQFRSHVEDDVNHRQTLHQEEVFDGEKIELSMHALPSEINDPVDSQPQDCSLSVNEQASSDFGYFGSHRSKGRRIEEHEVDILQNAKDVKALETINMSVESSATSQISLYQNEEHDVDFSRESAMFSTSASGPFSEKSTTAMYPETDPDKSPKSETLPGDQDERETNVNVEVSSEAAECKQQEVDECDFPHGEETNSALLSARGIQGDKVRPTQVQEILQTDYTFETMTGNPEIIAENLISQAARDNMYTSELTEKSTDDSAVKLSAGVSKQSDLIKTERNLETVDMREEDYRQVGSPQTWTSNTESTTGLREINEDESKAEDYVTLCPEQSVNHDDSSDRLKAENNHFSRETLLSEINSPSDLEHADRSVSTAEQTDSGFGHIGNRRKLGSSRRNKGKLKFKESKLEVLERNSDEKDPETTEILLETKITNQDKLSQDTEHGLNLPVSHDNSMLPSSVSAGSSEVESCTPKIYFENDQKKVFPQTESFPEEQEDERETDVNVEVSDEAVEAEQCEVDECDILRIGSSKDASDAVISANPLDHAEILSAHQTEFTVEDNDNPATKQEVPAERLDEHAIHSLEFVHLKNEDYTFRATNQPYISHPGSIVSAPGQAHELKGQEEDDIKSITDQEKENSLSQTEELKPVGSPFETGAIVSFDYQHQESSGSVENTGFHQTGHRRKMGSSRRNKGQHKAKDSAPITYLQTMKEADGKASSNQSSEDSTPVTESQEKFMEIILEGEKMNIPQTEEENIHFGSLVCAPELTAAGVHSTSTVDQKVIGNSCNRQMPDEELPNGSSPAKAESMERHECTEPSTQDGNLQEHSEIEPHLFPIIPEIQADPGQNLEKLSPEEEAPVKEEELIGVGVAQNSGAAAEKELEQDIESVQARNMSQNDYTTETEGDEATVNTVNISRNLVEQTEIGEASQSEPSVTGADHPNTKMDDIEREETALGHHQCEIESQLKDAMNPNEVGTGHHIRQGVLSEICDSTYYLQSPPCETNAPLDSQLPQNFNAEGNSGGIGSSQEKPAEIKLEGMSTSDTLPNKQNECFGTASGLSDLTTKDFTVEQLIKSNFKELPEDEPPTASTTTENMDREILRLCGDAHGTNSSSENSDLSIIPETTTVKNSTMLKVSVAQDTISSQECVPSNGEEEENLNLSEAAGVLCPQDVESKEHEEQLNSADTQEMPQINYTTCTENNPSLQTHKSDSDPPVDSKPLGNYQSLTDETLSEPKPAVNRRKMGSSRRHKGRQQGKDNAWGNRAIAASDINPEFDNGDSLKSDEDLCEKSTKHISEPDNSCQLAGHDTVKKHLMQSPRATVWEGDSDMQRALYHDHIINPQSDTVPVPHQEEAQTTRALSHDGDSQQTETVECLTVEDCSTEVDSSMDVKEEPAEDASSERDFSTTKDEHSSLLEKFPSDEGEKLQVKSQQKRRKMGSTRRTPLHRRQEEDNKEQTDESSVSTEDAGRNPDKMEVTVESLLTADVAQSENVQSGAEQQETDRNTSIRYEEHEIKIDPVTFSTGADENVEGKIIDHGAETSQQDDFTSIEVHKVSGTNSSLMSQSVPQNSEANSGMTAGSSASFCEVTPCTQNNEDRPESVKLEKVQDADGQNPIHPSEGFHLERKSPSPNLNSPNRRRKLGSTRKNLSSRTKREDLHQNQELENEAAEAVTETDPRMTGKDLQPHAEHQAGDSDQRKEKINETVEICHVMECLVTPQSEQKAEGVSQSQPTETENQQSPSVLPSNPPTNDPQSESAYGGRRKKFGSNRKSGTGLRSSHAGREARTGAENEKDVKGITEEAAEKEPDDCREESPALDKIQEVAENDERASTDFSISSPKELSERVSERTSTQPGISLTHGSHLPFAGGSRGTDFGSKGYNVVMIGDSYVGKTSFMKRAQNGKFSLDLSASVGLDSCMWTVVVEGKPVVLQLWDTAGQERFRSITRQIFHKAQAFLLMYDITCTQSFSAVSYWANSIQEGAADDVTVLLLGNKSDHEQRQVKTQQGEILAKEYNFEFMECSAATGENVIEALETVARMLSQRPDSTEEATALHSQPAPKKRSTCC
ncbi:unnamed protein product [Menidia menidia]|uniref:(Atlantic silverside) hypothetical protein n=1 Tax=Menidia menidia TaxID=238744 RepID=A0A8S4BLV0_9TELE|nr:unnamed protein product [Menidia menidia]